MDVYTLILAVFISLLGSERFRTREASQFVLGQVPAEIGWYTFTNNESHPNQEIGQRCKCLADHVWPKLSVDQRQEIALKILPEGWLRHPRIGAYLYIQWNLIGKNKNGVTKWRFEIDKPNLSIVSRMAKEGILPRLIRSFLDNCAYEELAWWRENRYWLPDRRERWPLERRSGL